MICVIGHKGVVGSASYRLFQHLGYAVSGADKNDRIPQADVYFICTSETVVEDIVKSLPEGLVVIRSTVPPLTTERLSEKYKRHICHNPEFLNQARALIDIHTPDSVVIGECCAAHGVMIEELYRPLCCPIVRTQPRMSEMVKLARNGYTATAISFWNEIDAICRTIGISGHQVGMIASYSPVISSIGSRLHQKYSGACIPKDMKQIIKFACEVGVEPVLLEAVEDVNGRVHIEEAECEN